MPTIATSDSPFRRAVIDYGDGTDALWEYLEAHKHENASLAVGWALERAKRFFNIDAATVASRTAVYDSSGNLLQEPISKSFVSALLSGRTQASPPTYSRLAHAAQVSPLEFFLAEQWIQPADIAAFGMPEKDVALPIIERLLKIPEHQRPRAKAVVLTVLDSIEGVSSNNGRA